MIVNKIDQGKHDTKHTIKHSSKNERKTRKKQTQFVTKKTLPDIDRGIVEFSFV
jgi:hypothetical protein